MIKRISRRIYRKGLADLSRGDLDAVLSVFHPSCRLRFIGDTPLGADLSDPADIRRWFERFQRLLPDARFEPQQIVVSGPPWNLRLAGHVVIRSTVVGEPYENEFAHFLRLRWGRVVDDLILEDTQRWARACERLRAAGVLEAAEPPMVGVG